MTTLIFLWCPEKSCISIVHSHVVCLDIVQSKKKRYILLALCEGSSLFMGAFFSQIRSYVENISFSWHHHEESFHHIIFLQLSNGNANISVMSKRRLYFHLCIVTLSLDLASPVSWQHWAACQLDYNNGCPDSKVHGAYIETTWGRQDPGGPHVGPMNFAIWVGVAFKLENKPTCGWRNIYFSYNYQSNAIYIWKYSGIIKIYSW